MNKPLLCGGILSSIAAIFHLSIIIGGPDWYRFFGAGEDMAQMAESGSWFPPILTLGIAAVLLIWALYAYSGAGLTRPLPLLKPALVIISLIYLLRGLAIVPVAIFLPETIDDFLLWSSLICLIYGLTYAVGTKQIWHLAIRHHQ